MPVRFCFIFFNYLMAILGATCLVIAGLFPFPTGETVIAVLVFLCWLEWKRRIPLKSPAWFSLIAISIIVLPVLYFLLNPEIPNLLAGFLVFVLITRFVFKSEFNDFLYGHLIAIVCLLIGALFIQDLTFAFLFLGFFLVMCWSLIFYNLMAEQVGSRSPPQVYREAQIDARLNSSILGLTSILVLFSLVLTSLIFISFPRMGLGIVALNKGGVPISGFSDRVEFGEVGLLKQNDTVVLRVQFSKNGRPFRPPIPALWRGVALNNFDGKTWTSTLQNFWSNNHRPGRPLTLFAMKPEEMVVHEEIFMENIETPVVFTYGLPLSIDGTFKVLEMDSAFSFKTESETKGPRRFYAVADIGPTKAHVAFPLPGHLDPRQRKLHLQLPELSPEIKSLAFEITKNIEMEEAKANALLAHFSKGFTYSLEMKETERAYLDEFLFHRKAGHCEYFATALTILLRQSGIPARIVNGFMGVEWNEMGEYMIVRQTHAHSWVEAFLPEKGWVTFDPTPPDPTGAAQSPSRFSLYMDLLRLNWQRYVVKYNLSDQTRMAEYFGDSTRDILDGFKSLPQFTPQSILPFLKRNFGKILGCLFTLIILIWALKKSRKSRLVSKEKATTATIQYNRMLSRLEKKGVIKEACWTPREFISKLDALTPEEQNRVSEITQIYEKSRYAGKPLEKDEEHHMSSLIKNI
ncbi:MAG: DUF3488 domain-containing transglutaminase family protein [Candidatus Nitronauta litoralis]|uniref:DUF3488 domain-containing transglutaminase family protein n=1 Tax=Candidatus Nitronauta litoralis TaxID=2705533 RepID=A0A7T0BTX2_9BACT|nr:MAG: DUF3488 domain-containing transglutaminase family protein [Candidatus Nitronauta litoralis]